MNTPSALALGKQGAALILRLFSDRRIRPVTILVITVVLVGLWKSEQGASLYTEAILFAVLQQFALLGLVALSVGITVIVGEFDISVGAVVAFAGIVAADTSSVSLAFGLVCATLVGLGVGLIQGSIVTIFKINSAAVTLGGLLTLSGLAEIMTDNGGTIPVNNINAATAVNQAYFGVLTVRGIIAIVVILLVALIMGRTPLGRLFYALGSSRRALVSAGVSPAFLVIGVFAFCSAISALGGGLLSYSLQTASATGLTNVLIPAVAAAILGGVSLTGGEGYPLGIAVGALTLSTIEVGLATASPWLSDLAYGIALLLTASAVGPELHRRASALRANRLSRRL
jgi:ribose/xylose/arabinose/galactoside ABC-type transport system permease subunit